MTRLTGPSMPRLRSTAAFGIASVLANVLGYLTSIVLARGLSSDEFGAVGALLALGIIGTIPYTAVQLAVSRRAGDALASGGLSRSSVAAAGLAAPPFTRRPCSRRPAHRPRRGSARAPRRRGRAAPPPVRSRPHRCLGAAGGGRSAPER